VAPSGPVVGLVPDGEWGTERVTLSDGRTLVLFTDGLTEARSASGAFLPSLLEQPLTADVPAGAQEAVTRLVAALDAAAGDAAARDDLAILALSPARTAARPGAAGRPRSG
jgi:sigma-B regulation protein RsbU (phosphoserine phosphatase)